MKVHISRVAFSAALKKVQSAVGRNTDIQIARCVRIADCDGGVKVSATNMDVFVETRVGCTVEGNGEFAFPFQILQATIDEMGDGVMTVDIDGDRLMATVRGGNARVRIAGYAADEFPVMRTVAESSFSISGAVLGEMIRKVEYAASLDDTRKSIKGILLRVEDGLAFTVGCDGRRLAYAEHECDDGDADVVVPRASANMVRSLFSGSHDVDVIVGGGTMQISDSDTTMRTKLSAEPYPNFRRIMPENIPNSGTVDRAALVDAIRRASVMRSALGDTINIEMRSNGDGNAKCTVSSATGDAGDATDSVDAKWSGPDVSAFVDAQLVLAPLRAVAEDDVDILIESGTRPIEIRSTDFRYVLMPMRVQ